MSNCRRAAPRQLPPPRGAGAQRRGGGHTSGVTGVAPTRTALGSQRGLSLIELIVGLAIGLFVVGGALTLFVDYLASNRRLLVETRVTQELRVAADLMAREMRRAGYWTDALTGAKFPAAVNPHRTVAPATTGVAVAATDFDYQDGTLIGFKREGNKLRAHVAGSGWQDLTDPESMVITKLEIVPDIREVSLGAFCTPLCTSTTPGCPVVRLRQYIITLAGRSPDGSVRRELRESVRLRNDEIPIPACP